MSKEIRAVDSPDSPLENPERRPRRLFDAMTRNIGREVANYFKQIHVEALKSVSKMAALPLTKCIRNDIDHRMRPLLIAMIAGLIRYRSVIPSTFTV